MPPSAASVTARAPAFAPIRNFTKKNNRRRRPPAQRHIAGASRSSRSIAVIAAALSRARGFAANKSNGGVSSRPVRWRPAPMCSDPVAANSSTVRGRPRRTLLHRSCSYVPSYSDGARDTRPFSDIGCEISLQRSGRGAAVRIMACLIEHHAECRSGNRKTSPDWAAA